MAPRSIPQPASDAAAYRDLLLFEERLKSTAASLQERKTRYQLFLFQLIFIIVFLLIETCLPSELSMLSVSYGMILQQLFPKHYKRNMGDIHPYVTTGLLFVSVTTLILFFASGMYSEKIAYANKYVPHANKALRSFNMYLNVRKPPLRSKFRLNPLGFIFARRGETEHQSETASTSRHSSRSNSPRRSSKSIPIPIAPIPPAENPRGELIFSSRVDRSFKEGYERYRAAFERRREEKERLERGASWWTGIAFWRSPPAPSPGMVHSRTISTSSNPTIRSRVSRTNTPRSGSPLPVASKIKLES